MAKPRGVCVRFIWAGLLASSLVGCSEKAEEKAAAAKEKEDPQWVTKGHRTVNPNLDRLH